MTTGDLIPRSRTARLVLAVALLAFAAWPFLAYLRAIPLTPDAIAWIQRSRPGTEGWGDWIFRSSHFVGYRPLTGLSFAADVKLCGLTALGFRATDLMFHMGAGILVVLLARRLGGTIAAVVAGLVFFAHPATEEVVPFLARRSYSLATVFAFAGLLLATRPKSADCGKARLVARTVLAGPLLALALFSHELGALQALALPFVAFARTDRADRVRAAAVTAWGFACVLAAYLVRQQVLGQKGGYSAAGEDRAVEVTHHYLAGLGGWMGDLGGSSPLAAIATFLPVLYLVPVSLWLVRGARRTLLPAGLVCVLVAYGVAVVSQRVWFPREAYPAVAIFALLLGAVAARTWADGERRPVTRRLHGLAQLALVVTALGYSPLLHGPDATRLAVARRSTDFVDAVREDLNTLERPAAVDLIIPVVVGPRQVTGALRSSTDQSAPHRHLRVPFRWLRFVQRGSGIELSDFAYVDQVQDLALPTYSADGRGRVTFAEGAIVFVAGGRRPRELEPHRRTVNLRPPKGDGARYLWLYDADGGGALVPLP